MPLIRKFRHAEGFEDHTDYIQLTDNVVSLHFKDGTSSVQSVDIWPIKLILEFVRDGIWVEIFDKPAERKFRSTNPFASFHYALIKDRKCTFYMRDGTTLESMIYTIEAAEEFVKNKVWEEIFDNPPNNNIDVYITDFVAEPRYSVKIDNVSKVQAEAIKHFAKSLGAK